MAVAQFDARSSNDSLPALPLTLDRQNSPTSIAIAATFIALAAAILLAPFSLLAAQAAHDPVAFLATIQQPAIALQLSLALVVAVVFVTVPLRLLLRRSMQPRRIVVSGHRVEATNDPAGQPTWSEPLSAYHGVAHHIRTSLSGARHEIVLVHPVAAKSIVLMSADRIGQPQVDAMAALLKVREVPARALYQNHPVRSHPEPMTAALSPA